jgi:hypothetical protein
VFNVTASRVESSLAIVKTIGETALRRMDEPSPSLAIPDVVATIVIVLFAFTAGEALAQSDGDLFAHIRLGQIILESGRIPQASVLGFAGSGPHAVFPAWLAAVCFALLSKVGGLALIVAVTAVIAGVAHGLISELFRRRDLSARANLLASFVGFALASSHWLARPHEFSLLFVVVLLLLLESSQRWAPVACGLVFALWANLHGAWAFGIVLLACYVLGDAIEWRVRKDGLPWRSRFLLHAACLLCAAGATLINPYGLRLHRAVFATLSDRSVATLIDEYRPPGLTALPDVFFFLTLLFAIVALIRTRRRMSFPAMIAVAVTTIFALRAGRNIALFGLVAWPLIVLHITDAARERAASLHTASGRATWAFGAWTAPVAAAVLIIGALHGRIGGVRVISDEVNPARFPVAAVARLRNAQIFGPTLTTWLWSGYVPYAWAGERVFFDPLLFSPEILDSFGRMLLARPGWRDELRSRQIVVALLPPGIPLADSLARDAEWTRWYAGGNAVIFRRIASGQAARATP